MTGPKLLTPEQLQSLRELVDAQQQRRSEASRLRGGLPLSVTMNVNEAALFRRIERLEARQASLEWAVAELLAELTRRDGEP